MGYLIQCKSRTRIRTILHARQFKYLPWLALAQKFKAYGHDGASEDCRNQLSLINGD